MNEFPVQSDPYLYAKGHGIAEGQTLQVAVRKCMAENYFEVQKTILERDQSFSSTQFYQKPIWAMLICG